MKYDAFYGLLPFNLGIFFELRVLKASRTTYGPWASLPKPPAEREADLTARGVWHQYSVAVGCRNNEPRVHLAKLVAHSRQGADNRPPSLSPAARGCGHSKSLAADFFFHFWME